MPYIDSSDVRLYYETVGTGDPIVFVHEYAGDYRSWSEQVRYFSRHHRCVTFNARGYPPSDVPDSEAAYSYQHAVADIHNVLSGLNIDRAHIVGLSMGGYAALHFALRHPEKTRSVVLAATGHGSDPAMRDRFLQDTRNLADKLLTAGMAEAIAEYADSPIRRRLREKDPRGFDAFFRNFAEHSPIGSALTAIGYQMKRPSLYLLEQELKSLDVPSLVVIGDDDTPCIAPALFLKSHLRNCQLAVFPHTTHAVNLEEPELFNRSLEIFFGQISRNEPRLRS
ncbi:alpha/beta fold hydrolase [Cupriavidus sp. 30B13]|uniref:alpha/beta fold hydrolase n=1 Tax=Cupriavidus sp. 30B13 TaxID=3384241 RepID=UPI003B90B759